MTTIIDISRTHETPVLAQVFDHLSFAIPLRFDAWVHKIDGDIATAIVRRSFDDRPFGVYAIVLVSSEDLNLGDDLHAVRRQIKP